MSGTQTLTALTVFIALGSATVFAPVLVNLLLGERAAQPLGTSKAWLEANNATVMAVLLLVMGAVAFGKGLATLIAQPALRSGFVQALDAPWYAASRRFAPG